MRKLMLDGAWKFRQTGTDEWLDGRVPSSQFADLLALGKIPDPFVGTNERDVAWVGESEWTYEKSFDVSEAQLAEKKSELVFEMVDTLADVTLNGEVILHAENINRRYVVDVTKLLRAKDNVLTACFHSATEYVKREAGKIRFPINSNGIPGSPYIRKTQSHFGWDWGPRLITAGFPKSVYVQSYSSSRVAEMRVLQSHYDDKVSIDVIIEIDILDNKLTKMKAIPQYSVSLFAPDGTAIDEQYLPIEGGKFAHFEVTSPELWYPRDMSDVPTQPLYTVRVSLPFEDGEEVVRRIGLRTVELVQCKDEFGRQFQFKVNGLPVFAKGANWIPADSLITRFSRDRLDFFINSILDANLNMVRVWGGGFYESDEFYDKCDENGILVWQDFCFACGVYPFFCEEFLKNVLAEVGDNVRRLRDHASLALWCGNNEIESMLAFGVNHALARYAEWTEKFFYHILPKCVEELDGVTPFIPGSPVGDAFLKNVASHDVGDVHLWSVWHGLQPLTFYRKKLSRFCSEFGMESLPDMKTIMTFARPEDLSMDSDVFMAHQKCASGNAKILFYIAERFRLPKKFEDLVELSQIVQSECVRDATEHWHRHRGRCNGSIYWQLNDCWPVLSWASEDYFGRYKALHYTARHFNAPYTISLHAEGNRAFVTAINDTRERKVGTVRCTLQDFGGTVAFEKEYALAVGATNTVAVCSECFEKELKAVKRNAVFTAELLDGEGRVIEKKTLLFAPEKKLALPNPKLSFAVEEEDDLAKITVKSEKYARYVHLDLENGCDNFSDNWFDMCAGDTVTVTIPRHNRSKEEVSAALTAKSVFAIEPRASRASDFFFRLRVLMKPLNFVMWLSYILQK